ncbi:MAG: citrate lyase acyl carrier protein [Bacillota bacterium]
MSKRIITGSLESSDCMVTLYETDKPIIEVDTIVHEAFHDHILKLVNDTLKEEDAQHLSVRIQDKGALDYAIKARLLSAIEQYRDDSNG